MAILGGAGNPVGGSFTGPAQALEIIGDHAYAYSGVVSSAGSAAPLNGPCLSFTTGNYYTVAKLNWVESAVNADNKFITVTMNGAIIFEGEWDPSTSLSDMNQDQPVHIIIPAYTEFFVGFDSNGSGNDCTVLLTGRIYRTRDD